MKNQSIIALVVGAAALTYLVLRKKYSKEDINDEPAETSVILNPKRHHLTNVFAKAKKHALHMADNASHL